MAQFAPPTIFISIFELCDWLTERICLPPKLSMEGSKGEGTRKDEGKGKERKTSTKEFLRGFSGKVNQDPK